MIFGKMIRLPTLRCYSVLYVVLRNFPMLFPNTIHLRPFQYTSPAPFTHPMPKAKRAQSRNDEVICD